METKEYTTIDKSSWPSGLWDYEPDKVQWEDEETKLPCLAVRHGFSGHWCGYVGVTEDHPHYKDEYNDVNASVHGGLTFSDMCQPTADESTGICHTPGEGEPDHVWWFGFDCHHINDLAPNDNYRLGDACYRTLSYVKEQCRFLAKQLKEMQ